MLVLLDVGILTLLSGVCAANDGNAAADLIAEAHKFDNMYTLGPEASQQKAIEYYSSALESEPDDEQRLHALHRMAQLYGSAYRLDKGEKPDFNKAISLYNTIVDSYPSDEPLVYESMLSVSGHYTTLRQFHTAVDWASRTLEYDTSDLEARVKAIEEQKAAERKSITLEPRLSVNSNIERHSLDKTTPSDGESSRAMRSQERKKRREARRLDIMEAKKLKDLPRKSLKRIKRSQLLAVDQVVYAARLIDASLVQAKLSAIAEKYAGTFIADRANELLAEHVKKQPPPWEPPHDELFDSPAPDLLARMELAGVEEAQQTTTKNATDLPAVSEKEPESNDTDKPSFSLMYLLGGALVVLCVAGILIGKKLKQAKVTV